MFTRRCALGRASLTLVTLAAAALLLLATSAAHAQTGVDDDRVSLPEGPGSLEGVGDDVEINANMGAMSYSVPFELPGGFPGVAPQLGLTYSSGSGSGPIGIGWTMIVPTVERMTARGVPTYTTADYFDANGAELVQTGTLEGDLVYRMRFEGAFVRFRWVDAGTGDEGYWVSENPDGTKSYYGADSSGALVDPARSSHPDGGTARYFLVETVDPYGHSVRYTYDDFGSDWPLLTGISWLDDGSGADLYTVELVYEDRPDFLSDASVGFEELLTMRLDGVIVRNGGEIVREYALSYQDDAAAGGFSRLERVERYGLGGRAGGELFPVAFSFDYSQALGVECTSPGGCDTPTVVSMGAIPGSVNLASGTATLVDINADGLPDVLDTSQSNLHRFALNTLTPSGDGFTHAFVDGGTSQLAGAGAMKLVDGGDTVQVVDVDGDGLADLLDTTTGSWLENGGDGDWASRGTLDDVSALLGLEFDDVRFIDIDDDKRVDLISSTSTTTTIYHNDADSFSVRTADSLGMAIGAGATTQFADLNGDGLNDPVEVSSDGLVSYRLNLGHGTWSEIRTIGNLTIATSDRPLMDLEDLNGDGIADIVIVTGAQVKYALNRNGARFDPFVIVTSAAVDGEIPDRTGKTVLYSDMNANGSDDVVWFDASGNVTYLELFPVRPNLLTRIDNGIGFVQRIDYGTAAEHAARAEAAGEPWANVLSIPMQVVDSIDSFVTLTGDEDGSGLHNVTRYEYRDGFYDGVEKMYRGFEHVVLTQPEADHQEPGETTLFYDVGRELVWRNGLQLSTRLASDGRVLNLSTSEFDSCTLAEVPTPAQLEAQGRKAVYWPCLRASETVLVEGLTDESEWVTVRSEFEYDGYGRTTLASQLGDVAVTGDELYTRSSYVEPSAAFWHTGLVARTETSALAAFPAADTSLTINYYDGADFVGLGEGEATHGFLTRTEVAADESEFLQTLRQRRDAHGNSIETLDPEATLDGADHRRSYVYDASGLFLTTTDIHLGEYELRRESRYETTFQRLVESTQWMIVRGGTVETSRNSNTFRYDDFGRLVEIWKPGDEATSSTRLEYELGEPFSRLTVRSRSTTDSSTFDEELVRCFDGRGRAYQERGKVEPGLYQVNGFTSYNARGVPVQVFQAYTSDSAACEMAAPTGVRSTTTRFDAAGRVIETSTPAEDLFGAPLLDQTRYFPLRTETWDPEDLAEGGEHAGTPVVRELDGLGRPVVIDRTWRDDAGALQSSRTTLHYDDGGDFVGYTDAAGNRHELTLDRAGRVVRAANPNFGEITYRHDDAGNIVSSTDARGVTVVTVYDGQNRLRERYDAADRESTLVTWHYDTLPDGCDRTECTNLAGRLAAVEYPLELGGGRVEQGSDRFGYDVRGREVFAARRFGMLADLAVRRTYDNSGRVVGVTQPDGTRLEHRYSGGRLTQIPGYVGEVGYDQYGLLSSVAFANGARLALTRDALGRASTRTLTDGTGATLLDLQLSYDRVGHVVGIEDALELEGLPSFDAALQLDAWYRLVGADLDGEALTWTYDEIDRITSAISSLETSPAHRGEYRYDAAQPQAAVAAGSLELAYDVAGQMTARGDLELERDWQGRIAAIARNGESQGTILYGTSDRVAMLGDEDGALVLYGFEDFEVRDGVSSTWVRAGGEYLARRQTTSLAAAIYPNPDGDSAITAGDAFVAHIQGDESLPMRQVLGAAAARLLAEQEDATNFLHVDHLGSVILATDEGGEVRGRRAFYPYGQLRYEEGYVDVHGFTGQEHDTLTGTIHMAGREFDPAIGRWDRFDPLFVALSVSDMDALGEAAAGYAYVGNGPSNTVDPSGLISLKNLFGKLKNKLKRKKAKSNVSDASSISSQSSASSLPSLPSSQSSLSGLPSLPSQGSLSGLPSLPSSRSSSSLPSLPPERSSSSKKRRNSDSSSESSGGGLYRQESSYNSISDTNSDTAYNDSNLGRDDSLSNLPSLQDSNDGADLDDAQYEENSLSLDQGGSLSRQSSQSFSSVSFSGSRLSAISIDASVSHLRNPSFMGGPSAQQNVNEIMRRNSSSVSSLFGDYNP